MTNYSRGYALENQVVKKLIAKGFIPVRSAGSHSPWDITCLDDEGQVHLIQVKKSKTGYFNKRELEVFKKLKVGICVFKHFWVWKVNQGWVFKWDEDNFRIEL